MNMFHERYIKYMYPDIKRYISVEIKGDRAMFAGTGESEAVALRVQGFGAN